jgi:hypothetical protein
MGAKHAHKGNLKDISFLPKDTEAVWETRIPKIWTGPTIYAESCLKALKAMGAEADAARFDYSYFYAHFSVFCKEYGALLMPFLQDRSLYSPLRYHYSVAKIFLNRCVRFARNILVTRLHMFGTYFDDIPTSFEAQKCIDRQMEQAGVPICPKN